VQVLNGAVPANTPVVQSFEVPGGALAYSGGGYTVAQLAVVEAGGKAYPELLESLVLRPAGMTRSTFAQPLPERMTPQAASGHDRNGKIIPGHRNVYPEYAAASLWTTPSDYGRFLIGLQNAYAGRQPAFLRQSSVRTMATPVSAGYGLGADIKRRGGRPAIGHGGSNAGFQCVSFAFLDGSRQGVVVMTNSDGGGVLASEVIQVLADTYGWGAIEVVAEPFRRAPYIAVPPK
jgi:CubicO group peptidase (beta-lactamase class C family)